MNKAHPLFIAKNELKAIHFILLQYTSSQKYISQTQNSQPFIQTHILVNNSHTFRVLLVYFIRQCIYTIKKFLI